jgi:hypothetical protein
VDVPPRNGECQDAAAVMQCCDVLAVTFVLKVKYQNKAVSNGKYPIMFFF